MTYWRPVKRDGACAKDKKKMAATIGGLSSIEQRSIVKFLTKEGVKPNEILSRLQVQYGDECMSKSTLYLWHDKFKSGHTSVSDAERLGRPTTSTDDHHCSLVNEEIMENRRVTIDNIERKLEISHGSVSNIIHDILKYHKVSSRWVPRQLTDDLKQNRVLISQAHLSRFKKEKNDFLYNIITCDETWLHHFEPESKKQSMEWRHTSSPRPKKFKRYSSAGKVLSTFFWDSKGVIFIDFLEEKRTINSEYYSNLLKGPLREAIRRKRPGMLRKGVIFHHDNARPHTAKHTMETLRNLRWELISHPAYSPDLAPCDFHLFPQLKDALRGRRFTCNSEVEEFAQNWCRDQPKIFFSQGFDNLVKRWDKCIEKDGDFVEK